MPTLTDTGMIDFLAWRLYSDACARERVIPPLWLCVRDEIRLKYLSMARKQYVSWVREERAAEVRRSVR